MNKDEEYMRRCLQLAREGAGNVAPNPLVGAVLVYEDRIIGEGFHQRYGEPHAEVNCIGSVSPENGPLIQKSKLYVSLEPCAHHGKTPPCADLIISQKIPRVAIGCRDPFPEVNGKGIEKLKNAGIEVELGLLEEECREMNKRFFCFHRLHRPYIILKWAQTADWKIAHEDYSRAMISNEFTNRLVHRWRSEEASILVGTRTALNDDPVLSVRHWHGPQPLRLVVDMHGKLPSSHHLMDGSQKTIVFNTLKHEERNNLLYYQVTEDTSILHQVLHALYQMKILSVFVEGGARLLQSFIDEGLWDEARIITNESMKLGQGIPAPVLEDSLPKEEYHLSTDHVQIYRNFRA